MHRIRSLWLTLVALAAAGAAGAAPPITLAVAVGGKIQSFPVGPGLEHRLEPLFQSAFADAPSESSGWSLKKLNPFHKAPEPYRSTRTWRVVEALGGDELAEVRVRVMGILGKHRRARVRLVLDDRPEGLTAGAKVAIPVPGTRMTSSHTVAKGESWDSIGRRYGLTRAGLLAANADRFAVQPRTVAMGRETMEVQLGEAGLVKAGIPLDELVGVVAHELAHTVDWSPCEQGYGSDGRHLLGEVLTPAAAFSEGWADSFQLAHSKRLGDAYKGGRWLGGNRRHDLLVETRGLSTGLTQAQRAAQATPGYAHLSPAAASLGDLVRDQLTVAFVIHDLTRLAPGTAGVDAAFSAMPDEHCRHLGSYLASYLGLFPGMDADVLRILKRRTFDRGTPAQYWQLLGGEVPEATARAALQVASSASSGSQILGQ